MADLVIGNTTSFNGTSRSDGASAYAAELGSNYATASGGALTLKNGVKFVSRVNTTAAVERKGSSTVELEKTANVTLSSNTQEYTYGNTTDFFPGTLTINSGVYVWSNNTATPALTITGSQTVNNSGYIIGKGGNGASFNSAATAGGTGLRVTATGVTINNNSNAYIAGGGGGGSASGEISSFGHFGNASGGGGAGGGAGGTAFYDDAFGGEIGTVSGGAGGAIGASGGNGGATWSGFYGNGGGAGGSGGTARSTSSGDFVGAGGGGGRILPGTGGAVPSAFQWTAGGAGGSGGNAGGSGGADGGGGWGAAGGGTGAAGGAAISSTQTYTLTNNGTIYGTT